MCIFLLVWLGWKWLKVTNTLAYCTAVSISVVKKIVTIASVLNFRKNSNYIYLSQCQHQDSNLQSENTKGGIITVPLTSCLTGLDWSVWQIKTKFVSCHMQLIPKQSNRRSIVQWYFPFSIPCFNLRIKNWLSSTSVFQQSLFHDGQTSLERYNLFFDGLVTWHSNSQTFSSSLRFGLNNSMDFCRFCIIISSSKAYK